MSLPADAPTPPAAPARTLAEWLTFLQEINELEASGLHAEAVDRCRAVLDGSEVPEVHLAIARNSFNLAAGGERGRAREALAAALTGIEKRCSKQPDLAHAVGICRWAVDALLAPAPAGPPSAAEALISELEAAGRPEDVVTVCEAHADGESPTVHLALARNRFALAAAGDERRAWPALLAALDGLERCVGGRPDAVHAVGVCRAVLDGFADWRRLDVRRAEGCLPSASEVEELLATGQHVRLGNQLLAAAPGRFRYGLPAAGVAREVDYLLANLLSTTAGERAQEHLRRAGSPAPSDREAEFYTQFLYTSARAEEVRLRARRRGAPGVLIAAMPKSASEFLCSTLARATGGAVVRVTVGDPIRGVVYAPWVEEVLKGGCVTHDHFAASEVNVRALREAGARRVVVLVRDPRAVCSSLTNMLAEYDPAAAEEEVGRAAERVKLFADWIASWVKAAGDGFDVEFVTFPELTAAPAEVMGRVLERAGGGRWLPTLLDVVAGGPPSSNFRKGDDAAWRERLPADLHGRLWELIPDEVRALLNLRP